MSDECKPHSIKGHDLPTDTEEIAVMLMTEGDQVISLGNECECTALTKRKE